MIRKAVIPAAGFGTRFLPQAKAMPKEMLPIVDTPTIQLVVEEAVSSGIKDILIITGKGKRAVEEHFDGNFELETELEAKGKKDLLREMRRISSLADIHFIRQKEMNGLGDAISYAEQHVGNEPFAVLLGDTVIDAPGKPITRQLMDIYDHYDKTVIGLEEVPKEKVSRYGIVGGDKIRDGLVLIRELIEKPPVAKAPSNLAIAGRYILTPKIFEKIRKIKKDKRGEIQLTNAIQLLLEEEAAYGLRFDGKRYDIGNKLDFLKTNVEYGLRHKEFGVDFQNYLTDLVKSFKTKK
ncbi:MAG: UTP--glucose-1-phosphate uridylyltransferase GalU [Fibrobacteres bacterium]|nr:UTP--glucose-1-phosphate uridylyltransferase GalU [Fibrobacterota bacterium]